MPSKLRFLLATLFFVVFVGLPSLAFAEQLRFTVVYHIPEVTDQDLEKYPGTSRDQLIVKKSRAIGEVLAKKLRKRLKAAAIKDYRVTVENFDVKVVIGGHDAEDAQLIELIKKPFRVELRPILNGGGIDWKLLQPSLPNNVYITQTDSHAFLTSSSEESLADVLSTASMLSADTVPLDGKPAKKLYVVGPANLSPSVVDGQSTPTTSTRFRSYYLGADLTQEHPIVKTTWTMDQVGGYTATLLLKSPIKALPTESDRVALLVDDEIVGAFSLDKPLLQLQLSPPATLAKASQRNWARAQAGRFAAEITLPFAISKTEVVGK